MKTLFIVRHAEAAPGSPSISDYNRPLTEHGKQDAEQVGRYLQEEMLTPSLILTSRAVRAEGTATIIAEASGYESGVRALQGLYLAPPMPYLNALSDLDDAYESAMVVGHNPGLEELLYTLTRQERVLATAALAQIELPISQWVEIHSVSRGTLVQLWRPEG